jgi:hypothetical protein
MPAPLLQTHVDKLNHDGPQRLEGARQNPVQKVTQWVKGNCTDPHPQSACQTGFSKCFFR